MMTHREALILLVDFRSRSLDGEIDSAMKAHVMACRTCRDWLASYRTLAESLARPVGSEEPHPTSEELAVCATRPEEVYEEGREDLRRHLANCASCREVITSARDALAAARPVGARTLPPSGDSRPPAGRRLWLAAAAIVLVAFGVSFLLRSGYVLPRSAGSVPAPGLSPTKQSEAPSDTSQDRVLTGGKLDGEHLVEAERLLTVADVTIGNGATVTFRAGSTVAFGDGLVIGPDARVVIETRAAAPRAPPRTKPGA